MKICCSIILTLFLGTSILFASVDLEVCTGTIVETTNGGSVEIDGALIESGTGYFKGRIASGTRTDMTSFAGLMLSSGMNGVITRTTGEAYAKGNGEGTNFKRFYELNNTGGSAVTADLQMEYVSSGDNDERNGLSAPYYILRWDGTQWTRCDPGGSTSPLPAADARIPTGQSDWIISRASSDIALIDFRFDPDTLMPGQGATLYCRITNEGETHEEITTLFIKFVGPLGTTKQSEITLSEALVGVAPGDTIIVEAALSPDFVPGSEGVYNCTVCIHPVPGEVDTEDNCRTKYVRVGESTEVVTATVGCDGICEGNRVVIPIDIVMSGMNPPDEKLGSYTATLDWDPALLDYAGYTGGTTPGWENPTVNESDTSSGHFDFGHAHADGSGGIVNIINVTFNVIGSTDECGVIDLDFSAMAAANTFVNLMLFLIVDDCDYCIESCGILGDVNGNEIANSTDALIVLSCDVGINTSQFCPMNCGDVNDDGFINSTDALIILSYDVGMEVPFPVGEPGCPQDVTPCPGCNE